MDLKGKERLVVVVEWHPDVRLPRTPPPLPLPPRWDRRLFVKTFGSHGTVVDLPGVGSSCDGYPGIGNKCMAEVRVRLYCGLGIGCILVPLPRGIDGKNFFMQGMPSVRCRW